MICKFDPPSTGMLVPVIRQAPWEASKAMTSLTSSGLPILLNACMLGRRGEIGEFERTQAAALPLEKPICNSLELPPAEERWVVAISICNYPNGYAFQPPSTVRFSPLMNADSG
jgi:hypothetical protein